MAYKIYSIKQLLPGLRNRKRRVKTAVAPVSFRVAETRAGLPSSSEEEPGNLTPGNFLSKANTRVCSSHELLLQSPRSIRKVP